MFKVVSSEILWEHESKRVIREAVRRAFNGLLR